MNKACSQHMMGLGSPIRVGVVGVPLKRRLDLEMASRAEQDPFLPERLGFQFSSYRTARERDLVQSGGLSPGLTLAGRRRRRPMC